MDRGRFGNLARDTRVRNRHSLKEVADGLGKSIVYISDIERGHRNAPPPAVARVWARIVGGSPGDFEKASAIERQSVELTVDQDQADTPRNIAALALARRWDKLSADEYQAIFKLVNEDTEDE